MAVSMKEKMECRAWAKANGLNENTSPAVLLYFEDFLVGVADMDMKERGQYITLLCLQNSKGHLSEEIITRTMKPDQVSSYVMEKFKKDDQGRYYNERMEYEIYRRVKRQRTLQGNLAGAQMDAQKGSQMDAQKGSQVDAQKGPQKGAQTEIEIEKEREINNRNIKKEEPTYTDRLAEMRAQKDAVVKKWRGER